MHEIKFWSHEILHKKPNTESLVEPSYHAEK